MYTLYTQSTAHIDTLIPRCPLTHTAEIMVVLFCSFYHFCAWGSIIADFKHCVCCSKPSSRSTILPFTNCKPSQQRNSDVVVWRVFLIDLFSCLVQFLGRASRPGAQTADLNFAQLYVLCAYITLRSGSNVKQQTKIKKPILSVM